MLLFILFETIWKIEINFIMILFFRLCLQIMPDTEHSVAHEWNLISVMTIFNTLGTKILPVQGDTFIKFHKLIIINYNDY